MDIRDVLTGLALFFWSASALINPAYGDAFQRMLIVPGTVIVSGGGSGELPARCLDRYSHQPSAGLPYQAALIGSDASQVKIGNSPPISIQQAINRKLISIEGWDGQSYTKLRVQNLTNQAVQIVTTGATVLGPDRSYPSDDLNDVLPILTSRKIEALGLDPDRLKGLSDAQRKQFEELAKNLSARSDNQKVWELRAEHSAKSFTNDQLSKLRKASLTPDAAAFYDAVVRRNLSDKSKAAMLLFRTETDAGPVHALFSGTGQPMLSEPYGPIGELVSAARKSWQANHPNDPLAFSLGAAKTPANQFDATYVLLAAVAAGSGGGGSGGIVVTNPAGFPEPPAGWTPFSIEDNNGRRLIGPPNPPGVGRGSTPGGSGAIAVLVTAEKDGPYRYVEKFKRGEARAFARQEAVISSMAASIHQTVSSAEANTLDKDELLKKLERSVRSGLDRLYTLKPGVQQVEKGGIPGAHLDVFVDDVSGQYEMAKFGLPLERSRVTFKDGR